MCEEWEECYEAPADEGADNNEGDMEMDEEMETESDPAIFNLIWGASNTLMVVAAGFIHMKYTTYAEDLSTANIGTNATWTNDVIKESDPIAAWFTQAKIMGGLYFSGWLLWALNLGLDNAGGPIHMVFLRASEVLALAPLITLYLTFASNGDYTTCDDAETNSTFVDSAATISSCTDGTDAKYGDSGSLVVKVNDDPKGMVVVLTSVFAVLNLAVAGLTFAPLM